MIELMPENRYAYCLFCDDIRQEVGNKTSFMGVYSADMIFPPDPPEDAAVVVAKMVIVVWLVTDINDRPTRGEFILYGPPGKSEIGRISMPPEQIAAMPASESARKFRAQGVFQFTGFHIQCSGHLEAVVQTERE